MLPIKFWFIWSSGFRGEDILEINRSETRMACSVTGLFYTLQVGIHFLIFFLANLAKGNMSFCHHLVSVICRLSSVYFSHFNLLQKSTNQKQELPVVSMFVNQSGQNEQSL
jgi:hypothetical protein